MAEEEGHVVVGPGACTGGGVGGDVTGGGLAVHGRRRDSGAEAFQCILLRGGGMVQAASTSFSDHCFSLFLSLSAISG